MGNKVHSHLVCRFLSTLGCWLWLQLLCLLGWSPLDLGWVELVLQYHRESGQMGSLRICGQKKNRKSTGQSRRKHAWGERMEMIYKQMAQAQWRAESTISQWRSCETELKRGSDVDTSEMREESGILRRRCTRDFYQVCAASVFHLICLSWM